MKNSTTKRRFDSGYGGWSVASRCLLCLAFLLAGTSVWAQTHRLTGRVTDDKDQAVVGASVIVKGTTQGITTDSDGNFTLDLPNGDATLVVSFIGYRTQEVPVIRSQSRVNVELAPESIAVDEVVVVGYGEQSRRSVTSSIAKLDGEALQNIPISTVGEGLKGKIAGLKVTQTNFSPGGGFSYQIRGGSSINGSNSPLVLVDGIERDMDFVDADDIATFSILKDATATALYGVRGANGIILITTKRGTEMTAPQIRVKAEFGITQPVQLPELANASQWIDYYNELYRDSGSTERKTSVSSIGKMPKSISICAQIALWVSITPLGLDVVPDV